MEQIDNDKISMNEFSVDPFPGLAAFTEINSQYFFGRNVEIEELQRLVKRDVITVLFGISGLGKTSLLQAGLFPRLRKEDFLPIPIRLSYSPEAPPLVEQIWSHIEQTIHAGDAEVESDIPDGRHAKQDGMTLWEYFHRAKFWSSNNKLLTPVLVFDQFEEIFTLGKDNPHIDSFMAELTDLVENHIPESVRQRFEREEDVEFNYDRQNFKILLSLREDYLPHLEQLGNLIHAFKRNRMRLNRLNGVNALEAVSKPVPGLIDSDTAEAITRFVAESSSESIGTTVQPKKLQDLEVEPALLSVVCRELNHKRLDSGKANITKELLNQSRSRVLYEFYERSLEGIANEIRIFIEDRLLTRTGFRSSVAWEDAVSVSGISEKHLMRLIDRRLLRSEDRLGTRHLELTHDVLSRVIMESRDKRHLEEERKQQLIADREQRLIQRARIRKMMFYSGLLSLVVFFLLITLSYTYLTMEKAQRKVAEIEETNKLLNTEHNEYSMAVATFLFPYASQINGQLNNLGRIDLLKPSFDVTLPGLLNLKSSQNESEEFTKFFMLIMHGKVYLGCRSWENAQKAYTGALKFADNLNDFERKKILAATAIIGLGDIYYAQGQFDEARVNYLKAGDIYNNFLTNRFTNNNFSLPNNDFFVVFEGLIDRLKCSGDSRKEAYELTRLSNEFADKMDMKQDQEFALKLKIHAAITNTGQYFAQGRNIEFENELQKVNQLINSTSLNEEEKDKYKYFVQCLSVRKLIENNDVTSGIKVCQELINTYTQEPVNDKKIINQLATIKLLEAELMSSSKQPIEAKKVCLEAIAGFAQCKTPEIIDESLNLYLAAANGTLGSIEWQAGNQTGGVQAIITGLKLINDFEQVSPRAFLYNPSTDINRNYAVFKLCYRSKDELKTLLENMEQTFDKDSKSSVLQTAILGTKARYAFLSGQYTQAIELSKQAISSDPRQIWLYLTLVHSLLLTDQSQQAIERYRTYSYFNLGNFQHFWKQAMKDLEALKAQGIKHPGIEKAIQLFQVR